MKRRYKESRHTGISHKQQKEGTLTGLVACCVGIAFYNMPSEGRLWEK
jgi:hypothetical protein